jgi:hypothetical protein
MGSQERQMILQMLQEGRIKADEAEELLSALDRAERAGPRDEGPRHGREHAPHGPDFAFDFGDLGRGIREAARAFAEGMRKVAEQGSWDSIFGDLFRGASGGAAMVDREVSLPLEPGALPARLSFSGSSGNVSIRGTDEPKVTGTAHIRVVAANQETAARLADEVHVFAERREDRVEISARPPRPEEPPPLGPHVPPRYELRLELAIPRSMGAAIQTASGDIELSGLDGEITLTAASGNIKLSSVGGPVTASTGSGDLTASDCTSASLQLRSASGDMDVSISPPPSASVRIDTASGDLVLRIAREARARIEASSLSGEVTVHAPLRIEELSRSRLVGVLNAPEGSIKLVTASGNIGIHSPEP